MSLALINKVSCSAPVSLYEPKSGCPVSLSLLTLDLIAPLTQHVATREINSIFLIIKYIYLL